MPSLLRVLLVEDDRDDVLPLAYPLREAGFAPEWRRVHTESEYIANLDPAPDVILAECALPEFNNLDALRLLRDRGLSIPFIVIADMAGEAAAVHALDEGADDYLLKDRLARLGRAVSHAVEQRTLREAKQRAERELRDAQERLVNQQRAARADAEVASRMRDEFVAIASHELRTPLTAIKSTAQLLLSQFDCGDVEPTRIVDRLRAVNAMSDRLTVLIADLLDVTRLRTQQLQLRPEPIELARLVQQAVDEQRSLVGSHYPLSLTVVGALPELSADHYRIRQVLSNVLQNAVRYSPTGGAIEVSLHAQDAGVLVTVSDYGIGVPPEALETIFEPYGRACNAQRQQLCGMGLGLFIARQIVEQHGGRTWADSAGEGQGTRISMWLPTER